MRPGSFCIGRRCSRVCCSETAPLARAAAVEEGGRRGDDGSSGGKASAEVLLNPAPGTAPPCSALRCVGRLSSSGCSVRSKVALIDYLGTVKTSSGGLQLVIARRSLFFFNTMHRRSERVKRLK